MYQEQTRNNRYNKKNKNNQNNKKNNKRSLLSYEAIKKELEEIKERGIDVYINGDQYNIEELNDICLVLEESNYMKDFVSDGDGKIIEVHYDKIRF